MPLNHCPLLGEERSCMKADQALDPGPVPAGLDKDGLPLGLQILGRAFDEETVFKAGAALEKAAGFKGRAAGY